MRIAQKKHNIRNNWTSKHTMVLKTNSSDYLMIFCAI